MNERPAAPPKKTPTLLDGFRKADIFQQLTKLFSKKQARRKSASHYARRMVHRLERRGQAFPCTETTGDVHRAVRNLRIANREPRYSVGQFIRERVEGIHA